MPIRQRLLFLLPIWVLGLPQVHAQTHPGEAALVRDVAAATGKDPAKLTALLDGASKQQSILDAISRPAEGKDWAQYRPIFLTDKRIRDGIAFYRDHRAQLQRIGREYGVDPCYIVAIIGVETFYGRITGHYRVIDALATLAFYYPPRAKFFRSELKTLLELPDDKLAGPIPSLTGSYAGAQGWGQFMPSSIKAYAVDEDHDGHINLHGGSMPDLFASVANYFRAHGWQPGAPVAGRAQADAGARPFHAAGSQPVQPLEQFEAWGYAPLRHYDPGRKCSLLTLQGADGPEHWFTFQNFYVITRYNRSPKYAMAVHQLAQAIRAGVEGAAP